MSSPRILIIGGVAGGASCAARARRLSEAAEIILFEQGDFVSFANCGLPYRVGNVIQEEEDLLVATPELFKDRFRIEVRTRNYVRTIDTSAKTISIEDLGNGRFYTERYDALVLAPGAAPIRPPIKGIDLPGIFNVWTIHDSRGIIEWVQRHDARRAAVVGGGFIGLEMAENLKHLGLQVTVIEMQDQVMPALDPEMAVYIHNHLESAGVELCLGCGVTGFQPAAAGGLQVDLDSGDRIDADIVILAVGAKPRTELAESAGLAIGERGGIQVDLQMKTSDSHVWAVGDAVQVVDYVTGVPTLVPLAGPANRQGRLAADVIVGSSSPKPLFRGVQATSVCGIDGMTVASTGVTEKFLRRIDPAKVPAYEKSYIHANQHASYYPGAEFIAIKLLYESGNGRILGAQAVGKDGVEKRIDVISMAIQKNGTVFDLEEAELCYAPQYGAAKDPVNMAGMVAANRLRGLSAVVHWENLPESDPFLLDVRTPAEFAEGFVPDAVNIPVDELRQRLAELPKDRDIWTYCYIGVRSYIASRLLHHLGYRAFNVSGGYRTFETIRT